MFLKFVDRVSELDMLNRAYAEDGFHFIVIYGRRRVGKTELLKQFIKDKDAIYFLCDKSGTANNMDRFKRMVAEHLDEPAIETDEPEKIFSYIARKANPGTVLIFDEFAYLMEKDDAIASIFQRVIDEVLKNTNMMLVVCGSSMSMMLDGVLAHKSPLYGRKTNHALINPMRLTDINELLPSNTLEENIRAYSVLGGIPYYLNKFRDGVDTIENVRTQILDKNGALYEETDFLLREELREPDIYKTIVTAVASGTTRVTEIANKCRMKPQDLDRYLKVLRRLGIIKRECPITDRKSKKTIYVIDDNFFAFWFRYCEPRKADLEIGDPTVVMQRLEKDFHAFVGRGFEKIAREEMLRKLYPGAYTDIGRWWGHYRDGDQRKEIEIDILGLNPEKIVAGFFECKWQDLSEAEARKILDDLREKARYVEWHNGDRKETFGIFARSITKKESLRRDGFLAFDLRDFQT
ncbi:MAG: Archaeal ATPase [Methanocella sp. PtaU1.Bin125]|nr:MAG: Archaeal ATPase [Methanocella sp. PtaU1.Bin125]